MNINKTVSKDLAHEKTRSANFESRTLFLSEKLVLKDFEIVEKGKVIEK